MKNDGALLWLDSGSMAWRGTSGRGRIRRNTDVVLSFLAGLVPATQLVADVNGVIVGSGRISIQSSNKDPQKDGRSHWLRVLPRIVDVATPPRSCARPSSSREAKGWPAYS